MNKLQTTETQTLGQQYLADYLAKHDRESTRRHARENVALFEKWLKDRPLTLANVSQYKAHVVGITKSTARRNLILSHARCFLKWCIMHGHLQAHELQMREVFRPFKIESRLLDVLTKPEIERLVIAAGEWRGQYPVGAMVLAALLTGARRRELDDMPLRQIDLDNRKLVLISTKTRLEREFPTELCGVGEQLFVRLKQVNRRLCYENRAWRAIAEKAQVACQFKTLRATFSSYAKSAGANPWLIDKLLAHSAKVAELHYDRALVGIKGDNAPEWYGCPDAFVKAVEQVQIAGG